MKLIRIIAAERLLRFRTYLEGAGRKRYFASFPECNAAADALSDKERKFKEAEETCAGTPYYRLLQFLGGTKAAQCLLDLSVSVFLYPRFGMMLKEFYGTGVTAGLAFEMEGIPEPSYEELSKLYERAALLLEPDAKGEAFLRTNLYADNRLCGYLCGNRRIDSRLEEAAELFLPEDFLPPLIGRDKLCIELIQALEYREDILILKGAEGMGKKFLIRHACKRLEQGVVFARASAVFKKRQNPDQMLRLLAREAFFYSCGICFWDVAEEVLKKAEITAQEFLFKTVSICRRFRIPLYFCTDERTELLPYLSTPVNLFVIKAPERRERIHMWEQFARVYGLEIDAVLLGTKYKLTPEETGKACMQLASKVSKQGGLSEEMIAEVLGEVLPPVVTRGSIELRHPGCTLENLILPAETKTAIRNICNHVRYSYQVYDEWNLESRYAYGKAVSVLLSGPPGTGKTMTARVLADMLNLPLYRVNLSQLVDKYIGETEKHLEEIFANAERSNLILFFDEADAVFSKRSEITDAKDKHANTEISYILQRMESYDGIVLLSTNYIGNIDIAFMRRMQYILYFHLPDEKERLLLWERSIPKESPAEGIDYKYLAGKFEFSGSNIKNAVLTAAFLAAGEGKPITMKHVLSGVRNEFLKNGKPVIAGDFGEYAYLIQESAGGGKNER